MIRPAPSCGRTARGRTCSKVSCSTSARAKMRSANRGSMTTTRSSAVRSGPGEAAHIWNGVQKLEHVSITLGERANAQQIFESLNSTGEPLRDHELIHNYVLMGLSHAEQTEIEEEYWLPIEENTGDAIGAFWRHYLVMLTGREVAVTGGRGVYEAFHDQFPRLGIENLRAQAEPVARVFRHLSDAARSFSDAGCRDRPSLRIPRRLRPDQLSPRHAPLSGAPARTARP